MRCPDCNKFVGLELGEPEINSVDIDESGHIDSDIRIVRTCADCSNELKEATFNPEADLPEEIADKHHGDGHELSVDYGDGEATESDGGRYAKNMIGVVVPITVSCSCSKEPIWESDLTDEIAAGQMDELV